MRERVLYMNWLAQYGIIQDLLFSFIYSVFTYRILQLLNRMNKRNSQKKFNGQILLMQTELMSKLATINDPKKPTDELGFAYKSMLQQPDALLNLISKSKDITRQNAKQIDAARRIQSRQVMKNRKQGEGTFLTGLGLATETGNNREIPSTEEIPQQKQENDPNSMLKQLIGKGKNDDLQELRKMIRETSSNLQGCSKKLNQSKRSIMHIADRYSRDLPFSTLNVINNYRQFESKKLEDIDPFKY